MMQGNKGLHMAAWILVMIGGINWLLVAFKLNLVEMIFGSFSMYVYILVGLSAVYEIVSHKANCKACDSTTGSKPAMGGGMPMGGMPR